MSGAGWSAGGRASRSALLPPRLRCPNGGRTSSPFVRMPSAILPPSAWIHSCGFDHRDGGRGRQIGNEGLGGFGFLGFGRDGSREDDFLLDRGGKGPDHIEPRGGQDVHEEHGERD